MKAVVVLSGGLDSTVCTAAAVDMWGASEVAAISFDYGQKHNTELEAAGMVAGHYSIEHRIVRLPAHLFSGLDSSLTTDAEMPQMSYEDIEESYGVSPTYVPYRNGNLLSMATSYALTLQHPDDLDVIEIWAGMHAEDAHNWAYPDCTPEFLGAMASAIYVGSYHRARLVTPLMNMTKADIVSWGLDLDAPFQYTLSCYEGTRPACGTCPTCVGRINAFRANAWVDPIDYAIAVDWS